MVNSLLSKFHLPKEENKILVLLLSADLLYVFLHLVHKFAKMTVTMPFFTNEVFAIDKDLGLGEAFQYAKELWIVLLLLWLVFKYGKKAFLSWSLLFTYLLLDDSLQFHERVGGLIPSWLGIPPLTFLVARLRAKDLGEIAFSLFFGLLFAFLIWWSYRSSPADIQIIFKNLLWMLAALVFLGIVLDGLDRLIGPKLLKELAYLTEDGGEMVIMSVTFWYVYVLTEREKAKILTG